MATTFYASHKGGTWQELAGRSAHMPVFVDFTSVELGGDGTTGTFTTGDTAEILKVPAGTLITKCRMVPTVVEGAADTVDIGDGDTANGYANDVALNGTVNVAQNLTTEAGGLTFAVGKYYAAEGTIKIQNASAAISAAKFWLIFEYVRFSNSI